MTTTVAVRERPILMSGPMIRAILDGRKTQTRRVVTPQPPTVEAVQQRAGIDYHLFTDRSSPGAFRVAGPVWAVRDLTGMADPKWRCPYGQPGDRLWVRETWLPDAPRDGTWPDVEFFGAKGAALSLIPKRYRRPEHVFYRSTATIDLVGWRPSIHMPRWASRLTLELTGVRVERVRDISEVDCEAEGVFSLPADIREAAARRCSAEQRLICGARDYYRALWDSLNAARGYGWDANPWVWVLEFRRVEGAAE